MTPPRSANSPSPSVARSSAMAGVGVCPHSAPTSLLSAPAALPPRRGPPSTSTASLQSSVTAQLRSPVPSAALDVHHRSQVHGAGAEQLSSSSHSVSRAAASARPSGSRSGHEFLRRATVLPPPGFAMTTPLYGFALLGETTLSAREARSLPRAKRDLLCCRGCKERVVPVANNGLVYIRHFRATACTVSASPNARSAREHIRAVAHLKEMLETLIRHNAKLTLQLPCPVCGAPDLSREVLTFAGTDIVDVETGFGDYVLDVAVVRGDAVFAAFEVWNTNPVSDAKWMALQGIPAFEVAAALLAPSRGKAWRCYQPLRVRRSAVTPTPCGACCAPPPLPPPGPVVCRGVGGRSSPQSPRSRGPAGPRADYERPALRPSLPVPAPPSRAQAPQRPQHPPDQVPPAGMRNQYAGPLDELFSSLPGRARFESMLVRRRRLAYRLVIGRTHAVEAWCLPDVRTMQFATEADLFAYCRQHNLAPARL